MKGRFTIITILKSMRNPIESEKVLDFVLENTEGDSMEDKKVEKKEKKEYRSAIRSRRMIREAFMELVYEKKDGKVTVTDVVNRADINRSTFYAHYPDVQGIVEEMEEEIFSGIDPLTELEYYNVMENPTPFLKQIGNALAEKEELYRAISKSNYASHFEKKLIDYLTEYMLSSSPIPEYVKDSPFMDMGITFVMGGIVSVFRKWMQGELNYTLTDMTGEMEKLLANFSGATLDLGWEIQVQVPKAMEEKE